MLLGGDLSYPRAAHCTLLPFARLHPTFFQCIDPATLAGLRGYRLEEERKTHLIGSLIKLDVRSELAGQSKSR